MTPMSSMPVTVSWHEPICMLHVQYYTFQLFPSERRENFFMGVPGFPKATQPNLKRTRSVPKMFRRIRKFPWTSDLRRITSSCSCNIQNDKKTTKKYHIFMNVTIFLIGSCDQLRVVAEICKSGMRNCSIGVRSEFWTRRRETWQVYNIHAGRDWQGSVYKEKHEASNVFWLP